MRSGTMTVVFSDSMGGEHIDPDLGWMREMVLACSPEIWEYGGGDCALRCRRADSQEIYLYIVGRPGHGYLISDAGEHGTRHLVGDPGASGVVHPDIGGNPTPRWRRHLIDRPGAWELIHHAVTTGTLPGGLTWDSGPTAEPPPQ